MRRSFYHYRTTGFPDSDFVKQCFYALFALAATAFATPHVITVQGEFTQAKNLSHFGLALPIPFTFSVGYDDEAVDEDPSPLLGVYETPGAYVVLTFGNFFFWTANSEVRIWHGYGGVPEGISFGNEDGFAQHGLLVAPYRLYAFFPNFFWHTPGFDDSIAQVQLRQGDMHFEPNSYMFIYGFAGGIETSLQSLAPLHYSVH